MFKNNPHRVRARFIAPLHRARLAPTLLLTFVSLVLSLYIGMAGVASADKATKGVQSPPQLVYGHDQPLTTDHYVSPNGSSHGDGSFDNPWDLRTAFSQPSSVPAGDTLWLRGGTYGTGGSTVYDCNLAGTQSAPIFVRQYPTERAIVNGGITANGAYVTFWGFEITNTSTGRSVARDQRPAGLSMYGRGERVINMNIHDVGHPGISFWNGVGDGGEIYGTLIWHNGLYQDGSWIRGSAIYAQNQNGSRYIQDNIAFRNFTTGGKAYTEGAYADGFTLEGNAMFDNGEWNIFGSSMSNPMKRLRVISNYTYRKPGDTVENAQFGYYSNNNDDAVFQNNYFVADTDRSTFYVKKWLDLTVTGNTFVSRNRTISQWDRPSGGTAQWNSNNYYKGASAPFALGSSDLNFANWRTQTGYDSSSNYNNAMPTGAQVFVRPNRYEPGRANIIVYNWNGSASVQADISGILPVGTGYRVMDAQNFNGNPVSAGVYSGGSINLPMNLTTVAPYVGTVTHRPQASHTAPEFAAFVLLPAVGVPFTPLPTFTPSPTYTRAPTDTVTATKTWTPSKTPTNTKTTRPTRTYTSTRTPRVTGTPPTPANTLTPNPQSATPIRTAPPTNTPLPGSCYPVDWANLVNTTTEGNTLIKSSSVIGWNAGAVSAQHIRSGDGYIQATVDELSSSRMFGLGTGDDSTHYRDIEFAFYLDGNSLKVYEAGVHKLTYGAIAVGDTLRVAVEGGAVRYYRNGALIYTSATQPLYPLLLDAAINTPGARVSDAYVCGSDVGP